VKLIRELLEFAKSPGGNEGGDGPLRRKLQKVLDDLPAAFKKQANLEKAVGAALGAIKKAAGAEFDRNAPELSAIVHHYQPTASVIDMVLWNVPENNDAGDEVREQARAYLRAHHEKMLAALRSQLDALEQLSVDVEVEDWPAGQGSPRYTDLDSCRADVTASIGEIERIVKSGFKSWGR